ncbi:hypothetical protein AYI69_g7838 [Smittium culicis]|uniref:Uncharacterized protein n=1 Tax=Smittium culicis TaxID=133412 RepID=A0A1R1XP81_9FUNG|nr:hypothetical protein AYI69_g7838 [Smittium culicis]
MVKIGYLLALNIIRCGIASIPNATINGTFGAKIPLSITLFFKAIITHAATKNDLLLFNVFYLCVKLLILDDTKTNLHSKLVLLTKFTDIFIGLVYRNEYNRVTHAPLFARILADLDLKSWSLKFVDAINTFYCQSSSRISPMSNYQAPKKMDGGLFTSKFYNYIFAEHFISCNSYYCYHLCILAIIRNSDYWRIVFNNNFMVLNTSTSSNNSKQLFCSDYYDDMNIISTLNFYNRSNQQNISYFFFEKIIKILNSGNSIISFRAFNGLSAVVFDTLGYHSKISSDQILQALDRISTLSKKLYLKSNLIEYHRHDQSVRYLPLNDPNMIKTMKCNDDSKAEVYNPSCCIYISKNYILNTNVVNSVIEALVRKSPNGISIYEIVYLALANFSDTISFVPNSATFSILRTGIKKSAFHDRKLQYLVNKLNQFSQ